MARTLAAVAPTVSLPQLRMFSLRAIGQMLHVARQRQQLARLTVSQLADIGLTATDARIEANRAFWDAPRHWK